MASENIEILDNFTLDSLPNLDTVVLGALELFQQQQLPKMDLSHYKRPLVVGSGNAEATGRIMYETHDAIFASESNFEEKLQNIPTIDGVVLLSASGGKHAPIIAKKAKEYGKHVTLITNTPHSAASLELDHNHIDDEFVFPKNREPYTYNTSTYMGMILGFTGEDPASIERFIKEHIDAINWPDFSRYTKYYLIVPPEFSGIIRMLQVKFIELFGRNIARDVETSEYVRHATTVAPADELYISFGEPNTLWGSPENRLHIPLPEGCGYGAMMAVGYYTVSQIQKVYPYYFKENIAGWAAHITDLYSEHVDPIVNNK